MCSMIPKERLFGNGHNTGGELYQFKMLLPENSTNTGSEVFTEPRGLNKLLRKNSEGKK